MKRACWTGQWLLLAAVLLGCSTRLHADDKVSFSRDVAPLLLGHCQTCHGAKKAEGGYRVDSFERLLTAGDSELPGVTPGKPDDSEALRRIASDDESERMPLEADPLPADQIALVKRWIEQGASFDGKDPQAAIASLIPPPTHPDPPEAYRKPVPITALAFSPDGEELLVAGYHEITVWSAADGALRRRIKNLPQRTFALSLSPDRKRLAAAGGAPGRRGEVRLLDAGSGEVVLVLASSPDVVFDAAFDPAGERLATAGADNLVVLFDLGTGEELWRMESHADWVMALAWNHDGSRLATASRDKSAKVFDTETGQPLVTYNEHNASVLAVAFPEGEEVLTGGADNRIRAWKAADGQKNAELTGFGGQINRLVFGGESVFAPSNDKTVRQFNLKDRKLVRSYSGHNDWVLSAAFHPETGRLATGSFDGEVRIWDTADGKQTLVFTAAPGRE